MVAPLELSRGLTIREFAQLNGIAETTARRLVDKGVIPSYKVGGSRRIRADVAAALQQPLAGDR